MEFGNRTIVTITKRMLEAQKLKKLLWADVLANAVYALTDVRRGPCSPSHPTKRGVGGGFALHTCVCLEELHMQCFPMKEGGSLMRKESNFGNCEGMKAYRWMCLETKKIIKNGDVVFMEDRRSIRTKWER